VGVRDLYIQSIVRNRQVKSSTQQAHHEWTHFSPALKVSRMRTVRGMGSREKLTSWQYHIGSLFGAISVCEDRWWGCEGKCRYPDPQDHPIVASPGLVTPCHVHGHPFPSLPPTRQRQRRVSNLFFCSFEDVQRCSLLYDVIHEIYRAELCLNRLHMPPRYLVFSAANPTFSLPSGLYSLR